MVTLLKELMTTYFSLLVESTGFKRNVLVFQRVNDTINYVEPFWKLYIFQVYDGALSRFPFPTICHVKHITWC